jgi:hypothetical protein
MMNSLLIVALFLGTGFMLSVIQDTHLKNPFLSRMGFTLVSLGSFVFFLLGTFASLKFFFGF